MWDLPKGETCVVQGQSPLVGSGSMALDKDRAPEAECFHAKKGQKLRIEI